MNGWMSPLSVMFKPPVTWLVARVDWKFSEHVLSHGQWSCWNETKKKKELWISLCTFLSLPPSLILPLSPSHSLPPSLSPVFSQCGGATCPKLCQSVPPNPNVHPHYCGRGPLLHLWTRVCILSGTLCVLLCTLVDMLYRALAFALVVCTRSAHD